MIERVIGVEWGIPQMHHIYVLVWEYDLYPDISHLYCMVLIISWFGKSCFLSSISSDDIKCVKCVY